MQTKQSKQYLLALFLSAIIINIYAQDWPQYLGPNRNSTSPQKDIMRSWPEKGPEILWTADIGPGYGGPVVKDGKLLIRDKRRMMCVKVVK